MARNFKNRINSWPTVNAPTAVQINHAAAATTHSSSGPGAHVHYLHAAVHDSRG
ncbi:Hypothetical predicted protein, partial [Pelobates cultripes]